MPEEVAEAVPNNVRSARKTDIILAGSQQAVGFFFLLLFLFQQIPYLDYQNEFS